MLAKQQHLLLNIRRGISRWTMVAVAIALLGTSAQAAERSTKRLPSRNMTGSVQMRRAFREVVAEPSLWTVRIKNEKRDLALGVVVGDDGWVLTKASQLDGPLTCRVHGEREYPATIVGVHQGNDLAMLKIDAKNLSTVKWGAAGDPEVGRWLATPDTSDIPVAVGVVSVARRQIKREPGQLGIIFADDQPGPRVTEVLPNSGAALAGLQVGDVITEVAGEAITNGFTLKSRIGKHGAGELLSLRIMRGESAVDVRARLGHPVKELFSREGLMERLGGKLSDRRTGFTAALQHDTVLRPEDCGGTVVNLNGEAVGVNIARAGRTATHALPASEVLLLLDDLKSGRLAPHTDTVTDASK